MRVLFTAGGSGGHFYPLMSVADAVIKEAEKENVSELELYYVSDAPYSVKDLKKRNIKFHKISTGKRRLYSSFQNFLDLFRIFFASIHAFFYIFFVYPDVIFTNGSYAAFPTLFAAKILRIPVMVHASDTVPSRVVLFGAKFAKRISVGFPEAKEYFPKNKQNEVVMTGNPVRKEIMTKVSGGADGFLNFSPDIKTI
jgi:UDP-N-acetylglucosamine--N-acetylmuramyl-(pentapeptide) pyrophosphoryl-undecaprenol N-acetylglucosamine transferase